MAAVKNPTDLFAAIAASPGRTASAEVSVEVLQDIVASVYGGAPVVADSTARTTLFPSTTGDERVTRRDTNVVEIANVASRWSTVGADPRSSPTLEELERTIPLNNAAISATATVPLGVVTCDQRIGACLLSFSTAIPTDAASYWTFSLQYIRKARLPVQMMFMTTQTGSGTNAGQPIVANAAFTFANGEGPASLTYLMANDGLQLVCTKVGTPGNLTNGVAIIRYEPNLFPTIRASFSLIDSLTSLGTTDTGEAWSVMSQPVANTASVWGIKTGQAAIQVHSNQGRDYVVFNAGRPNGSLSAVLLNAAAAGLCGKMVAGTTVNPRSGYIHNTTSLFREDAGSLTAISALGDTLLTNDTLTLDFSADRILPYRNGVKLTGGFDAAYMASTLFGLRNTSGTANTGLIDELIWVAY